MGRSARKAPASAKEAPASKGKARRGTKEALASKAAGKPPAGVQGASDGGVKRKCGEQDAGAEQKAERVHSRDEYKASRIISAKLPFVTEGQLKRVRNPQGLTLLDVVLGEVKKHNLSHGRCSKRFWQQTLPGFDFESEVEDLLPDPPEDMDVPDELVEAIDVAKAANPNGRRTGAFVHAMASQPALSERSLWGAIVGCQECEELQAGPARVMRVALLKHIGRPAYSSSGVSSS